MINSTPHPVLNNFAVAQNLKSAESYQQYIYSGFVKKVSGNCYCPTYHQVFGVFFNNILAKFNHYLLNAFAGGKNDVK